MLLPSPILLPPLCFYGNGKGEKVHWSSINHLNNVLYTIPPDKTCTFDTYEPITFTAFDTPIVHNPTIMHYGYVNTFTSLVSNPVE